MIRIQIDESQLRAKITELVPDWFDRAKVALAKLPGTPTSRSFRPLWREIKQVYIELQGGKCCFCEKALEGVGEQDVEHFRPKTKVSAWTVPKKLQALGLVINQPLDGVEESGYARLAYEPMNYAIACATCNQSLKKNLFPIRGPRDTTTTNPTQLGAEEAYFIYPLGFHDADPELLIEYDGISPIARSQDAFERHRALVTIEVFRLDNTRLRKLFKHRAFFVRHLFLELEGRANAQTTSERTVHQTAIDNLTDSRAPFANCLRSFLRLYATDHPRARFIAVECAKLMSYPLTDAHRRTAHDAS